MCILYSLPMSKYKTEPLWFCLCINIGTLHVYYQYRPTCTEYV